MSGRKALRPNRVEMAVVALILGSLSCCLWPIVRDLRGPAGDPIPGRPPDEANRVHHPGGFSRIAPPSWGSSIGGSLLMAPLTPGRNARRSRALILVSGIGPERPSGLEGLRRTTFLGREAREEMKVVRPWTFDDGAWSEYLLYFRHGEDWYRVKYGIAEERTTLPDAIRRYINTLQWDENPPRREPGPPRLSPGP